MLSVLMVFVGLIFVGAGALIIVFGFLGFFVEGAEGVLLGLAPTWWMLLGSVVIGLLMVSMGILFFRRG